MTSTSPVYRATGRRLSNLGKAASMLAILAAGGWAALVVLYAPLLSEGLRIPTAVAVGVLVRP